MGKCTHKIFTWKNTGLENASEVCIFERLGCRKRLTNIEKMAFGKKKKDQIQDQIQGQEAEEQVIDLSKLKKKDLLEIMLKQGEEIDNLRAQVSDLQAQLEERNFKIYKAGSIAEASLQVTKIFEEAEKAAMIYLENIRSKVQ